MEWTSKLELAPAGLERLGMSFSRHTLNDKVEKIVGNRKAVINACSVRNHLLMYEVEVIADRNCWIIQKDMGFDALDEAKAVGEAWVKGEIK